MSAGRIAEAEVCESGVCQLGHVLVRGDRVSYLSLEAFKKSGCTREVVNGRVIWTPHVPKSDIVLPRGFVVVHDTSGSLLSSCDLYVVKWYGNGIGYVQNTEELPQDALLAARRYYGDQTPIKVGEVDIPEGPWRRIPGKIAFVRYRRVGVEADSYEHEWNPTIELYDCSRPLAWRMPLPEGCIVDERGFVKP